MIRINLLNSKVPQAVMIIDDSPIKRHPLFGATDVTCESCSALRDEIHIAHMRVVELEMSCDGYRADLKIQQRINRTLYSKLQHIKEIVNFKELL